MKGVYKGFIIRCAGCSGQIHTGADKKKVAIKYGISNGWVIAGKRFYCGGCQRERKENKGGEQ